jgi:hypothetical protein
MKRTTYFGVPRFCSPLYVFKVHYKFYTYVFEMSTIPLQSYPVVAELNQLTCVYGNFLQSLFTQPQGLSLFQAIQNEMFSLRIIKVLWIHMVVLDTLWKRRGSRKSTRVGSTTSQEEKDW